MHVYLTPDRYRQANFGIDVSELDDAALRAVLVRSSALVNAYTAAPNLPQRHDFRGGTATSEQHQWRLGTDYYTGTRRVYIWHKPIRSVASMRIRITNNYAVTLSANDLFINNSEGYIEVTSLAAVSFGIYPVGIAPNLGLYIPVAEVTYDYGWTFSAVDEPLDVVDGLTYISSHMAWRTSPTPVIKKNGSPLSSGYTIDSNEGTVKLSTAATATDVFTATYDYSLPDAIQEATGIIATAQLGERALATKGMTGLASVRIAEVALARTMSREGQQNSATNQSFVIPEAAAQLLDPYRFHSVG